MNKPDESCTPLPTPEQQLQLHQRLLAGDHAVTADLAAAFLKPLCRWLKGRNPGIPDDFCLGAACDALSALMKDPCSYKPERKKSLFAYLRMSAQGDLLNEWEKEQGHQRWRKSMESVEQLPDAWKYLGRDEDPSLPLQIKEEAVAASEGVLPEVRDGLTEGELRALDLILRREKKTAVFAEACGLGHLPKPQQRVEVKRLKDKVKTRLKRARSGHGRTS